MGKRLALASLAFATLGCGSARPLPPYPAPDRPPIEETDLARYVAEGNAARAAGHDGDAHPSETTTDSDDPVSR